MAGWNQEVTPPGPSSGTTARLAKTGAVVGGYAVAFVVASAVVAARAARMKLPAAQASGGMQAFGDSLLFLAVFWIIAIVPTGMALFFLRPYRRFWSVLSAAALGLAGTGLAASTVYIIASGRAEPGPSSLAMCASVAVLRLLLAPLLTGTFVLSALVAPDRRSRWMLLTAAVIEGAGVLAAILRWLPPFRAH